MGATLLCVFMIPAFAAEESINHIVEFDKMVLLPMPERSLEEIADAAAIDAGISTTKLRNLIYSESRWSTSTVGRLGELGPVQILPRANPEISAAEAVDPYFAFSWAAERLAAGEEWRWTVCSCVKFARQFIPNLPRQDAKDFVPNSSPTIGGIVIYKYPSGESHIAYIKGFLKDGNGWYESGSNIEPCLSYNRIGRWEDPALVGFAYYP